MGAWKNINLLRVEQTFAFLSWNSNFVKLFFQTHIWMKLKDSYLISNIRLDLIQRWCKQCSRHYKLTKPHKNKRLKRVIIPCNNEPAENTYFWVKIHASKARIAVSWRASKHAKSTGYCVVCGEKMRLQCWGCLLELKDIFPVCPTSVRDCFQKMDDMRNEIWISQFHSNSF